MDIKDFFDHVGNVLNIFRGSFKCRDLFRDHQAKTIEQLFESSEIKKSQGLHQECGLQRTSETRYNFIFIFSSIFHVLEVIELEGSTSSYRNQAEYLLTKIKTFEFIFVFHLMLKVLTMSNELSKIYFFFKK